MLPHFSKRLRLSIGSSSMQISFTSCLLFRLLLMLKFLWLPRPLLLPIIILWTLHPPFSDICLFSIFTNIFWYLLSKILLYLLAVLVFCCCVDYVFLVTFIFSFSSCQFFELSWLVCVCRTTDWLFSLVALIYQPNLNPSSRRYIVYELTIITTYHSSGHNSSYLTLYYLYWLLPTKQTKNKRPWFPPGPYHPRPFDILRFCLT